jgi:DNA-binding transcriptional LysR family regulator
MDAEGLSTFLAVHRQGGFSQAARVLGRTQPAITRRIHLLEEELGVPLFERTAAGPMLSLAGKVLLPHAERVLAALRDAEAAVRALATASSGPVALAAVGTLAGPPLTAILKRFAARHPGVDLTLRTATSAEVGDLVRRGEATIGLRYGIDHAPDLAGERIATEALTVVCAAGHRLAGQSIDTLAVLRGERWLAFPVIPGRREFAASHIFAVFETHGLGDPDWTPVDSLTAQKRLVEAGFGLALLGENGVAEELAAGSIARIRVRELRASQDIVAVTRKGGFLSAAARGLLDEIRAGAV